MRIICCKCGKEWKLPKVGETSIIGCSECNVEYKIVNDNGVITITQTHP